jgi:protein-S-isoprenylcysteine O-methyltransferase
MYLGVSQVLGSIFTLSEIGLGVAKRAGSGKSQLADRGSLALLWTVIAVSVMAAYSLGGALPALDFGALRPVARALGIPLFAAGLAIRWYAIIYLGRFFTVNVAIAADHRLIDQGPYRYIRHPSYAGAMAAFLGLGLCIGNWASVALLAAPIFAVFVWRMHVEEAALLHGLGEPYRHYMRHTKRLIPKIY